MSEYRVLARKYRPVNFDDLIGQDVLVRTLSNAIAQERVAHAFLLTGIRGIGKTTTARIIARALNCQQGPTIKPCGTCSQCLGIAEDRNVDVLEMDAASHTGVDAIRDLIETVRYLPAAARYKIYIIDEVHMLSNSAFNALLKTLEEPPPHVKFVFATTEIKKIPVTILSRCQRFDLKRINLETLVVHLKNICEKEQIGADDSALALIANAAEGSVRDALSLLDQAIARANPLTYADVRLMLGAADNTRSFALLENLLRGEVNSALVILQEIYQGGSDPLMLTQELMEITHLVTRVKVNPEAADDISLSEHDRIKSREFAEAFSLPVLARLWQMLLKGISEVKLAPSAISALEMLLIRIAYAAEIPTPAEIISQASVAAVASVASVAVSKDRESGGGVSINSFAELVALFDKKREAVLYITLKDHARLVSFAPGFVEINMNRPQTRDFAARIANYLKQWTGVDWQIIISDKEGNPSITEMENIKLEDRKQEMLKDPLISEIMDEFPGAKILQ